MQESTNDPPRQRVQGRHILLGVAFFLLAAEALARVLIAPPVSHLAPSPDSALGHALRPGTHDFEGNLRRLPATTIHVDSAGCRVATPDETHAGGTLVLGDSFTHGDGVAAEERWTERVNSHLSPGTPRLRNCAVPGYNLTQLARAAEVHAPSPALVLTIFSNDLRAASDLASMLPRDDFPGLLQRHSRLVRFARIMIQLQRGVLAKDPLSPSEIEDALDRLEGSISANGPRIAVILVSPHHPSVDLASRLRARDWQVLTAPDLSAPALRIPGDGHLNVRGHQRVADWLHPLLETALSPTRNP